MNDDPILRVCTKIIVGPIILFGLYVQFHGDYGPGGGFQAEDGIRDSVASRGLGDVYKRQ